MKRQFSKPQSIAIKHYEGPCLVLAGPGSGKTTVITHRTKSLIENYGVNPSNILVITFTKAAAREMQERFEQIMNGQRMSVSFGTFHAVFFRILKYAYNYSAQNILREDLKYRIVKEIVEKMELEIDDINDFTASVVNEISSIKGDMIDINNYYSNNCSEEVFRTIFKKYEEKIRYNNKIDFDDMLVMCYDLFKARPDILGAWQKKYKYILIDEFQDINRVQYEIVKMLALPENNLFIVGDDDQSIYRFRGARPEIMLNFEKDYADTLKVVLDENYRSTPNIVAGAGNLIKNNNKRFKKNIKPVREKGQDIVYGEFSTQLEENKRIVEEIRNYVLNGGRYKDVAVIFRTNIGPRLLIDKFMEFNIPFHMKDNMPNIYDHFIAKDIIAYINIARGCNKRSEYLQIINRPKRYISREAFNSENVSLSDLSDYYSDKRWMNERIEKLEYDLILMSKMSPYAAINYIRKGVNYDEFLQEYAQYRKMNVEDLFEVYDELLEASKPFKTVDEWFEHISEYAEELKKQTAENNKITNAIELCTMHSSKGLEFDNVYIIDAVEGVTPHNKASLDEDMEEERRMFYVAVTRAKNVLHIYSVKERFNKPVSTSRFVGEMRICYDDICVNDNVKHIKYGNGVIKKIDGRKITIYFPTIRKELIFDMNYAFTNNIICLVDRSS